MRRDGVAICLLALASALPSALGAQQSASEAVVGIGALDGAPWEVLDNVRGVVPLADGVVVADGGSRQIRRYPAAGGEPVWTFGREGEGPGEFQGIGWIAPYRADSLAVWDPWQGRLTVIGPDGSLGRTFSPGTRGGASAAATEVPPAESLDLVGAVDDGRFVARVGVLAVGPGDTTAVRRDRFDYVVLSENGTLERTLVTLPDDEQFVWSEGGSRAVSGRAFGRTTQIALRDRELVFATNDGFRVHTLPLDGGEGDVMEADRPVRAVTPADARRWRSDNAPSESLPGFAQVSRRRLIDAMPIPETFPAHGDLLVAGDGSLWLEEYPADPGADRVWTRFEVDGSTRRVAFPPSFRLYAVRDGLAWGVETGRFDVERVTARRLPTIPGGGAGTH